VNEPLTQGDYFQWKIGELLAYVVILLWLVGCYLFGKWRGRLEAKRERRRVQEQLDRMRRGWN